MEHKTNAVSLLKSGMAFLPGIIGYDCGNSEGTPCADSRPNYICKGHKWLREVRELLKREKP